MQMDDVSLSKHRQRSYVNAMGGRVNVPQMKLAQPLAQEYAQTLKSPAELIAPRRHWSNGGEVAALLCGYKHARLLTQVEQSRLKACCRYGCAAASVGGVNYQYVHLLQDYPPA
jgi:hypothetical protein